MMRLDVELRNCNAVLTRLLDLYASLYPLPPKYQKIVAEILMIRLFDLYQFHVKRIVCKVLCGCEYLDGKRPSLLHQSRSLSGAEKDMKSIGRGTNVTLRWSKVSYIKKNVFPLIDPNDHLLTTLDRYGNLIDEMRKVRNRIAHKNRKSQTGYADVLRRRYGARVFGVPPGTFLLSPRWKPTVMEEVLISTRILVRDLVKG